MLSSIDSWIFLVYIPNISFHFLRLERLWKIYQKLSLHSLRWLTDIRQRNPRNDRLKWLLKRGTRAGVPPHRLSFSLLLTRLDSRHPKRTMWSHSGLKWHHNVTRVVIEHENPVYLRHGYHWPSSYTQLNRVKVMKTPYIQVRPNKKEAYDKSVKHSQHS